MAARERPDLLELPSDEIGCRCHRTIMRHNHNTGNGSG